MFSNSRRVPTDASVNLGKHAKWLGSQMSGGNKGKNGGSFKPNSKLAKEFFGQNSPSKAAVGLSVEAVTSLAQNLHTGSTKLLRSRGVDEETATESEQRDASGLSHGPYKERGRNVLSGQMLTREEVKIEDQELANRTGLSRKNSKHRILPYAAL